MFVGLLVVAAWPGSMFPSWSPRFAVLLVVGPVGLVELLRLSRRGDRAAWLASGVVASLAVSAIASPGFRSSAFGFVGRDLSVLTVTLCLGCWALGCTATDRAAVAWAFVASASFVASIGIAQVVGGVDEGFFALQAGRPASLVVNPVYFGAICAGSAVAAVGTWIRSPMRWLWAGAGIALSSAGVAVSGSRVAVLALIGASLITVAALRTRTAATAVGIVALGLAAGTTIDLAAGSGRNAATRLGDTDGDGRSTIWGYGLDAWLDRPIFGHGIGRFRPATQQYFEADFVAEHAFDDRSQAWFDPHNALIMVLVAAGVIGLAVIGVWLTLAVRRCSGPLLWAAATIAATWMLQPVSIHTLPIAMLLFGASATGSAVARRDLTPDADAGVELRSWRLAQLVALGVGVMAAAFVLVADARLDRAVERLDPAAVESAAAWYWNDPVVDDVVAQVFEIRGDPVASLEWRERATEAEPDRPYWWSQLARGRIITGDLAGGRRAIDEALRLQPTNARALAIQEQLGEIESGG